MVKEVFIVMIKNIVFDLGNVLLKDKPAIILENIKLTDEIKNNIKKEFFNNWNRLDLGEETIEEHFNNCKFDYKIEENVQKILLNYYKYRPFNNEMLDLLNRLKDNNYKIFILSNNNEETAKYLKQLPVFQKIDGWVLSCDYHMVKPNKEIYFKLLENFNIKAEECFLIDDMLENIKTGESLGMKGFVFNNNIDDLIINLCEHGISEIIK